MAATADEIAFNKLNTHLQQINQTLDIPKPRTHPTSAEGALGEPRLLICRDSQLLFAGNDHNDNNDSSDGTSTTFLTDNEYTRGDLLFMNDQADSVRLNRVFEVVSVVITTNNTPNQVTLSCRKDLMVDGTRFRDLRFVDNNDPGIEIVPRNSNVGLVGLDPVHWDRRQINPYDDVVQQLAQKIHHMQQFLVNIVILDHGETIRRLNQSLMSMGGLNVHPSYPDHQPVHNTQATLFPPVPLLIPPTIHTASTVAATTTAIKRSQNNDKKRERDQLYVYNDA